MLNEWIKDINVIEEAISDNKVDGPELDKISKLDSNIEAVKGAKKELVEEMLKEWYSLKYDNYVPFLSLLDSVGINLNLPTLSDITDAIKKDKPIWISETFSIMFNADPKKIKWITVNTKKKIVSVEYEGDIWNTEYTYNFKSAKWKKSNFLYVSDIKESKIDSNIMYDNKLLLAKEILKGIDNALFNFYKDCKDKDASEILKKGYTIDKLNKIKESTEKIRDEIGEEIFKSFSEPNSIVPYHKALDVLNEKLELLKNHTAATPEKQAPERKLPTPKDSIKIMGRDVKIIIPTGGQYDFIPINRIRPIGIYIDIHDADNLTGDFGEWMTWIQKYSNLFPNLVAERIKNISPEILRLGFTLNKKTEYSIDKEWDNLVLTLKDYVEEKKSPADGSEKVVDSLNESITYEEFIERTKNYGLSIEWVEKVKFLNTNENPYRLSISATSKEDKETNKITLYFDEYWDLTKDTIYIFNKVYNVKKNDSNIKLTIEIIDKTKREELKSNTQYEALNERFLDLHDDLNGKLTSTKLLWIKEYRIVEIKDYKKFVENLENLAEYIKQIKSLEWKSWEELKTILSSIEKQEKKVDQEYRDLISDDIIKLLSEAESTQAVETQEQTSETLQDKSKKLKALITENKLPIELVGNNLEAKASYYLGENPDGKIYDTLDISKYLKTSGATVSVEDGKLVFEEVDLGEVEVRQLGVYLVEKLKGKTTEERNSILEWISILDKAPRLKGKGKEITDTYSQNEKEIISISYTPWEKKVPKINISQYHNGWKKLSILWIFYNTELDFSDVKEKDLEFMNSSLELYKNVSNIEKIHINGKSVITSYNIKDTKIVMKDGSPTLRWWKEAESWILKAQEFIDRFKENPKEIITANIISQWINRFILTTLSSNNYKENPFDDYNQYYPYVRNINMNDEVSLSYDDNIIESIRSYFNNNEKLWETYTEKKQAIIDALKEKIGTEISEKNFSETIYYHTIVNCLDTLIDSIQEVNDPQIQKAYENYISDEKNEEYKKTLLGLVTHVQTFLWLQRRKWEWEKVKTGQWNLLIAEYARIAEEIRTEFIEQAAISYKQFEKMANNFSFSIEGVDSEKNLEVIPCSSGFDIYVDNETYIVADIHSLSIKIDEDTKVYLQFDKSWALLTKEEYFQGKVYDVKKEGDNISFTIKKVDRSNLENDKDYSSLKEKFSEVYEVFTNHYSTWSLMYLKESKITDIDDYKEFIKNLESLKKCLEKIELVNSAYSQYYNNEDISSLEKEDLPAIKQAISDIKELEKEFDLKIIGYPEGYSTFSNDISNVLENLNKLSWKLEDKLNKKKKVKNKEETPKVTPEITYSLPDTSTPEKKNKAIEQATKNIQELSELLGI